MNFLCSTAIPICRWNIAPIAEFFHRSGKLGCMTVYRNEGRYDTSNVVFRDGEIVVYDKKNRSCRKCGTLITA